MLLFFMEYHGDVGIAPWEYMLGGLYVMVMYLYFARKKNMNLKLHPEYRYYMSGLMAKLGGGVLFCLIYMYYYQGGDSTAYFFSGVAMKSMLFEDPVEFMREVFLGDNSIQSLQHYAGMAMRPYEYVFTDPRTFQAVRVSSLLALFTFNSYLISTLVIASLSFLGIWACFRTFSSYYPAISGKLAIGFLYMPSAIFWGSGIMKDTFTFSACCLWIHAVDEVFFKRRNIASRLFLMFISAMIMIKVKPYIFMVVMPATLLWLLYIRVVRIKNVLVRFVLVPLLSLALVAGSIFILSRMGDLLDKFALDEALGNIANLQKDMTTNAGYGDYKFDIGPMDGTWWGVLKKLPVATNAALYRPYPWEVRNAVTALSGLENLFVLLLTVFTLMRAGVKFTLRCIAASPLLLMSMTFSLLFAFVVGITTPNFGALVRFKIPLMPFYISTLYVVLYMHRLRKQAALKGKRLDLSKYRMGVPLAAAGELESAKRKVSRRAGLVPGAMRAPLA
jgi:hypothetical protein